MNAPHGYQLISPERARAAQMLHVAGMSLGFTVPPSEVEAFASTIPAGRERAVEITDAARGPVGELAAMHASFPFTTRVPGGATVPTSGLSMVTVHPGHRRRGLLRAMITDHFVRSLGRGEVISTLFASEGGIYGRFGYGLAARAMRLELGRGTGLREVADADSLTVTIDTADGERHGDILRTVHAHVGRPGTAVRFGDESINDIFLDPESHRDGNEVRRIAVVRDGTAPVAYALFHRAKGTVAVRAWAALDARASRRLWSVMTNLDLTHTVQADRVAPDDPLVSLLADPSGTKMTVSDNLWLRILDLPAALEGRGWSADCDVTVAVADDLLADNAGTWHIEAVGGAARITRSDHSADISLAIPELSAAYLGGTTLVTMARAALVAEHRSGAVKELSRALASDIAPAANFLF